MLGGCCKFCFSFFYLRFYVWILGKKISEQKPLSIYSEVVDLNSFPLKSGDKIIKVNPKEVGKRVGEMLKWS